MRPLSRLAIIAAAFAAAAFMASPASAQASRTWISGVGDDANPCSRTAPCKTFAGAISKTAAGGEIDCLDPGGFGAVTITKSMTLDCGGGPGGTPGGILNTGTSGVTVNDGGANTSLVKIRNLNFDGFNQFGTAGIRFINGKSLIIEDVSIWNQGASGFAAVDFEPSAAGSKLAMHNVEIQYNASAGIKLIPQSGVAATATLDNVEVISNTGDGITAQDGVTMTIANSVVSENGIHGIFANSATGGNVNVNVVKTVSSENNGPGLMAQGATATMRLTDVSTFDNTYGIRSLSSGKVLSFGNVYNNNNSTMDGAPTGSLMPQ